MSKEEEIKEKESYEGYDIDDRKYRTIVPDDSKIEELDQRLAEFIETVMAPYIANGTYHTVDTSRVELNKFYTYRELCDVLGEKYDRKACNHYRNLSLRLWGCFMDIAEYENQNGNRRVKKIYQVKSIFPSPMPAYFIQPPTRSDRKILLTEAIFTIMRCEYELDHRELGVDYGKSLYHISGPTDFILQHFGFISDSLRQYIWDPTNDNKGKNKSLYRVVRQGKWKLPQEFKGLKQSLEATHQCYLEQVLALARENDVDNPCFTKATEEEKAVYDDIKTKKLEEMHLDSEYAAMMKDRYQEFRQKVLNVLHESLCVFDYQTEFDMMCRPENLDYDLLEDYSDSELKDVIQYCRNVVFQIAKQRMVQFVIKDCNHKRFDIDKGKYFPSNLEYAWSVERETMFDFSNYNSKKPLIPKEELLEFVTNTIDDICGESLNNKGRKYYIDFANFDSQLNSVLQRQIEKIQKGIDILYGPKKDEEEDFDFDI